MQQQTDLNPMEESSSVGFYIFLGVMAVAFVVIIAYLIFS